MGRAAGGKRGAIVALALAQGGLTACSDDSPRTLVAASEGELAEQARRRPVVVPARSVHR